MIIKKRSCITVVLVNCIRTYGPARAILTFSPMEIKSKFDHAKILQERQAV